MLVTLETVQEKPLIFIRIHTFNIQHVIAIDEHQYFRSQHCPSYLFSKRHTNVLESRKIKQRKASQKFIIPNSVCKQTNLSLLFRQRMLQTRWDSRKEDGIPERSVSSSSKLSRREICLQKLCTTFSPKLMVLII